MNIGIEYMNRLAGLQNRRTAYELIAENGERKVLAGYCARGRAGLLRMIRQNAAAWVAFAGADNITFAKKASEGAVIGDWTIRFSGRTEREVVMAGELNFFKEQTNGN